MTKKLVAIFLTLTLALSPLGNIVFQDYNETVSAKGKYKSGKKSFNSNSGVQNKSNDSKVDKQTTTNSSKTGTAATAKKGGLMKGLLFGGIAGLLFGSLLAGLGDFGAILGFLVNILAIIAIVVIARKIFQKLKKKPKEDENPWRS